MLAEDSTTVGIPCKIVFAVFAWLSVLNGGKSVGGYLAETTENTTRVVGCACNSADCRNFGRCSYVCDMENCR